MGRDVGTVLYTSTWQEEGRGTEKNGAGPFLHCSEGADGAVR